MVLLKICEDFEPESLKDYKEKIWMYKGKFTPDETPKHSALMLTCSCLLHHKYDFEIKGVKTNQEFVLPAKKMSSKQLVRYLKQRAKEDKRFSKTDEIDAPDLECAPERIDVVGVRANETIGIEISLTSDHHEDAKRLMKFPFTHKFVVTENIEEKKDVVIITSIKNFHEKLREELG